MKKAVLALGSNLGNRRDNMVKAIGMLSDFCDVLTRSFVYETPPVGFLEQPNFLNAAIVVATELEPTLLLAECKRIEALLGRKPSFKDAPRPVDIDIIFYEDFACNTEKLTIPHPRWEERDFVVSPLLDIAECDALSADCFAEVRRKLSARIRAFDRFCSL